METLDLYLTNLDRGQPGNATRRRTNFKQLSLSVLEKKILNFYLQSQDSWVRAILNKFGKKTTRQCNINFQASEENDSTEEDIEYFGKYFYNLNSGHLGWDHF